MKIFNFQFSIFKSLIAILLFTFSVLTPLALLQAQTGTPNADITSTGFKLVVCDGPENLAHIDPVTGEYSTNYTNPDFVPCNFKGVMMQVNHLLTIAIILGTILALCGMLYAGILYISGEPGKISEAHKIFPNIIKGFIIMLAAWFIVYQLLTWLTTGNTFSVLLGKPE